MFNTTRLPVSPFPGIILSYEKQLTTCRWLVIFSSLSEKATPFMLLEAKLYKHVYGCTHILVDYIGSNYSRVSAASSLLLIPSAEGSGIRADWAGADLEVSRCLSAEQAIVQQLHGCTTPALFRVYSAAPVKCRRSLLSDAKSVWVARECSLQLPVSSQKQLSLYEWGRFYTSKKTR